MAQSYAQNTNFTMLRGDTADVGMLTSNNETSTLTFTKNGVAQTLVGATIWLTAKYGPEDDDVDKIFQLTIGSGITILTAASGTFSAKIPASATVNLPTLYPVPLVFDIQIKDAATEITTIMNGIITVMPDTTFGT